MNDEYMIWDCLYETEFRLIDATPRRINNDCRNVWIEVGIVLAVIMTF